MALGPLRADPRDVEPSLQELRVEVTNEAHFFSAAGREVRGIKEQNE